MEWEAVRKMAWAVCQKSERVRHGCPRRTPEDPSQVCFLLLEGSSRCHATLIGRNRNVEVTDYK